MHASDSRATDAPAYKSNRAPLRIHTAIGNPSRCGALVVSRIWPPWRTAAWPCLVIQNAKDLCSIIMHYITRTWEGKVTPPCPPAPESAMWNQLIRAPHWSEGVPCAADCSSSMPCCRLRPSPPSPLTRTIASGREYFAVKYLSFVDAMNKKPQRNKNKKIKNIQDNDAVTASPFHTYQSRAPDIDKCHPRIASFLDVIACSSKGGGSQTLVPLPETHDTGKRLPLHTTPASTSPQLHARRDKVHTVILS
jgi:hypothetical protein